MRTLSNFLCLQWNEMVFVLLHKNRQSPCNKGTRKSWGSRSSTESRVVCCGISQALFWMRKRAIKIAHFCSRAEGIAKNCGWTKKENSQNTTATLGFFSPSFSDCVIMSSEEGWKCVLSENYRRTADGTDEESDFFISNDKVRMDFIMTF